MDAFHWDVFKKDLCGWREKAGIKKSEWGLGPLARHERDFGGEEDGEGPEKKHREAAPFH